LSRASRKLGVYAANVICYERMAKFAVHMILI
jgi:hypothetical protein